MSELLIDANTRIQVLDKMHHIGRARKYQYAAFVRDEGVLVVWADLVENIIPAAEALEDALMQFIWRGEEENLRINEKALIDAALEEEAQQKEEQDGQENKEEDLDPEDVEMRKIKKGWRERPTMLFAPLSDGFSIMLCMTVIALGLSESCICLESNRLTVRNADCGMGAGWWDHKILPLCFRTIRLLRGDVCLHVYYRRNRKSRTRLHLPTSAERTVSNIRTYRSGPWQVDLL